MAELFTYPHPQESVLNGTSFERLCGLRNLWALGFSGEVGVPVFQARQHGHVIDAFDVLMTGTIGANFLGLMVVKSGVSAATFADQTDISDATGRRVVASNALGNAIAPVANTQTPFELGRPQTAALLATLGADGYRKRAYIPVGWTLWMSIVDSSDSRQDTSTLGQANIRIATHIEQAGS